MKPPAESMMLGYTMIFAVCLDTAVDPSCRTLFYRVSLARRLNAFVLRLPLRLSKARRSNWGGRMLPCITLSNSDFYESESSSSKWDRSANYP
jgi:hypothetical protein